MAEEAEERIPLGNGKIVTKHHHWAEQMGNTCYLPCRDVDWLKSVVLSFILCQTERGRERYCDVTLGEDGPSRESNQGEELGRMHSCGQGCEMENLV